jgi:hypothetical protein
MRSVERGARGLLQGHFDGNNPHAGALRTRATGSVPSKQTSSGSWTWSSASIAGEIRAVAIVREQLERRIVAAGELFDDA